MHRANNIQPGPVDESVLYLQHVHISEAVWQGLDGRVLRPRRHASTNFHYPPRPLIGLLEMAGFYGSARAGYFPYNHHLVSAMVERWRPETHTFHMPMGECTITLEDVAIQLGLPIDGLPVIGSTHQDWAQLCEQCFGLRPADGDIEGQRLKMKWLDTNFGDNQIPKDATEVQLQQFTRAYIMRLIGGFLMPDTSGNWVQLRYLPLLQDLAGARRYSWGSAVLAFLFREMCIATRHDMVNIGGCMHLLHVWVWDRFPLLAPKIIKGRHPLRLSQENELEMYPIPPPLGFRWTDYRGLKASSMDLVASYRRTIDQMFDDDIVWQPYDPHVCQGHIPPYCREGNEIWRAHVPLICFHIVEWQQPDRVMRQFGLQQRIPPCPINLDIGHTQELTGIEVNWPAEQQRYVELWEQRLQRIITTPVAISPLSHDSSYMRWYEMVTRKWIDPYGAALSIAANAFIFIRQAMGDPPKHKDIRELCDQLTPLLDYPMAGPLQELYHPPEGYSGPMRSNASPMSRLHPVVPRLLDEDGSDNGGDDNGPNDDDNDNGAGDDKHQVGEQLVQQRHRVQHQRRVRDRQSSFSLRTQSLCPSVDFDTDANLKEQHEINVETGYKYASEKQAAALEAERRAAIEAERRAAKEAETSHY
ncbi:serine/threonine-protein phosphatase 7 long form-like protein [Senna tora]|uniref:Serine/threonine-protein phosphatase 7 long form-like protein n=1 Tax=Senna tora TaxID=362788 RepID=A0A835CKN5_9FABA|nr:serine/threonine-protein phosphatase 7 long form-like protein [Senna tora]